MKKNTLYRSHFRWFQYIILVVIAAIQIYPLIWLFMFSLKSNQEIFGANPMALPEKLLWSNFTNVLLNGNLIRYLFNSFFITFIVIILSTLFSAMAAYAIARMRWKLRDHVLVRINDSYTSHFIAFILIFE